MDKNKKTIHMVAFLLLVVGGLNWLLVGLFQLDVVAYLGEGIARIVYILVGASAVYELAMHKSTCKVCDKGMAKPEAPSAPMGGGSDQPMH